MALSGGLTNVVGVLVEAQTSLEIGESGAAQVSGALVFDATTTSEHAMQAEITSNPIESNRGDVTDHRRVKPLTWSFTATLVDEPDPMDAALRSSSGGGGPDPLESARAAGPQRSRNALTSLDFLRRLFESSQVATVTTDIQKMENAVLENLRYKILASTPVLDPSYGTGYKAEASAIEVSGSFREVRFASSEVVAVPKDEVSQQTGKKKPVQTQPAEAPAAVKDKANESIARFGARKGGLGIAQ